MKPLLTKAVLITALAGLMLSQTIQAQSRQYKPKNLAIPAELDPEEVKDAGNKALAELVPSTLGNVGTPKKLAILPLKQDIDGDYFSVQLSNLFSQLGGKAGFEIYTRDNTQWDALLQEIQWGDQFGDTMDPASIQKFGRIQGVQALVVGRVSSISKGSDGKPVVRLGIQVFEVETGKQLWGDEVKGTLPEEPPTPSAIASVPGGWITVAAVAALLVVLLLFSMVLKKSRPR